MARSIARHHRTLGNAGFAPIYAGAVVAAARFAAAVSDRNAPSVRITECVEDPSADQDVWDATPYGQRSCWTDVYVADLFDADGRFLGEVQTPPGTFTYPYSFATHIAGDRVVMALEDEDGVVRVKRYELHRPAGRAEDRQP